MLDRSALILLFSNIFVIVLALIEQWPINTFLWIYWFQSVIIGFFHFFRILSLQKFSTENFTINNLPQSPTIATKTFTAFFFAFHFGFFHFVYASLLASFFRNDYNFLTTSFLLIISIHFFTIEKLIKQKSRI